MDLIKILKKGVEQGCSNIFLKVNHPPSGRKEKDVYFFEMPPISKETMDFFLTLLLPEEEKKFSKKV